MLFERYPRVTHLKAQIKINRCASTKVQQALVFVNQAHDDIREIIQIYSDAYNLLIIDGITREMSIHTHSVATIKEHITWP